MDFWATPMKCPLQLFVIYFTMIEVEKIKLVWVGSVDIYFVNVGSKVIASRKYIKKINYLKFTDCRSNGVFYETFLKMYHSSS